MFNSSVKYIKRGPLTQAFGDHGAVKVQQTWLELLEIFLNTDTAVFGNTDTDIKKYRLE